MAPRLRDLLGVDVRIVGEDLHAEQAAAQFGDAPPDIADADDADGLAEHLAADEVAAVGQRAGAQRAVASTTRLTSDSSMPSTCSATAFALPPA